MKNRYVSRTKDCYCFTCERAFHYLGITNHRKMHKTKREDCKIEFTYGDIFEYKYSQITALSQGKETET